MAPAQSVSASPSTSSTPVVSTSATPSVSPLVSSSPSASSTSIAPTISSSPTNSVTPGQSIRPTTTSPTATSTPTQATSSNPTPAQTVTSTPTPTYSASRNANDYHAQFVSQSSYPNLKPNQSAILEVKVRNSGSSLWTKEMVHLGTDRPTDRIPTFIREDVVNHAASGWVAGNRISMVENQVIPGGTATFRFAYSVPTTLPNGVYKEYFRLVADGVTWMENMGIYWDVTVTGSSAVAPATNATTQPSATNSSSQQTVQPSTTDDSQVKIVDAQTGVQINNASVAIYRRRLGVFSVLVASGDPSLLATQSLPANTYWIDVTAPNYRKKVLKITLNKTSTLGVTNVTLNKK